MIKKVISNKNTLKSLKPKSLNEENIPYMQFFKSGNNFIITLFYHSATETAKTKDFPFFNQRKLCPSMFLDPNESLENRFNCKSKIIMKIQSILICHKKHKSLTA